MAKGSNIVTGLREERSLKRKFYSLPEDPFYSDVLIPGFQSANSVKGAFGWFTAGWIRMLAPGLARYLNRLDTGPIKFTVAPALYQPELEAINRAQQMSGDEASEQIARLFEKGKIDPSALTRHAIDCLSWMLKTDKLQLKIAVPKPDSNFHPKIWVFSDDCDHVVARGSGNATGKGVFSGVEHVDVDVSWDDSRTVQKIREQVDKYSRGESFGIERVLALPDALRERIITIAPDTGPTEEDYETAMKEDAREREDTRRLAERFGPSTHKAPRLSIPTELNWQSGDWSHQGEAATKWLETAEKRGLISMATGAGKTITALICATRVQKQDNNERLLIVVSAPSRVLVEQWRQEVEKFGIRATAPSLEGSSASKELAITSAFQGLSLGGTHVLIATNNLLCDASFQATIKQKVSAPNRAIRTMLISDEAHSLGADGFINQTPDFFEMRLALSATPVRQYDPDGTEKLFEFFGPEVYEFGLNKAIGFCLTPYKYFPHVATLDGAELEEFEELSSKIGRAAAINDEDNDMLQKLLIARRKIIETPQLKIDLLKRVLEHRKPSDLSHALIYASAKDPEQFDDISAVLQELNITWASVTSNNPQDHQENIQNFADGKIQVLLAKKVLDEGVDIPSIREAFIVASSTIEREWIQRRGRLLRKHPSKEYALIHDFLALPPTSHVRMGGSTKTLKKIIGAELGRSHAFAQWAQNAVGHDGVIGILRELREAYWDEFTSGSMLSSAGDVLIAPSTPRGRP